MDARTTIVLKGKEFPLYKTKRGSFDFNQAGFNMMKIATGYEADLQAFIYYSAKAVCKRENMNFPYKSLADFVDDEEVTMTEMNRAFSAMHQKVEEDASQGEEKPDPSTSSGTNPAASAN